MRTSPCSMTPRSRRGCSARHTSSGVPSTSKLNSWDCTGGTVIAAARLGPVDALVAAGAGFLLAVLWFDLMFDVQVRGKPPGDLPEPALASIAGYYRRVTTEARPMNRLVAAAMLVTLGAIAAQALAGD